MRICSFLFGFFLVLMFACYSAIAQLYPTTNLSTTWSNNGSLGNRIARPFLLRETNVGQFRCGFFCEGDCTSYILAIFISPINKPGNYEVVWSANRDHLVRDNAILNFTADGELVLKDVDGSIVWTTNTARKSVVGMNLTDTGNLMLFDDQNFIVWQSFDHPTDCLLPGQKLFQGQKLKASVSLTNFSEGMYSLQVTAKSLVAYVESSPPQPYYSRSVYIYETRKGSRRHMWFLNGSLSFFTSKSDASVYDGVIDIPKASSTQYMKLTPDGHLRVFEWQLVNWVVVADLLTEKDVGECDRPLVCGRNSICSANQQCICPKNEYFTVVNESQPEMGCSGVTSLTCNSTQHQDLITLENVSYFTVNISTPDMNKVNTETCKKTCLNNCSCKAAFFRYSPDASFGECFFLSELFTMKTVDPLYSTALAFIRVQNATSLRVSRQAANIVGYTIGCSVFLLVVAIGFITYVVYKRKRKAEMEGAYSKILPGMPTQFSYEELKTATENFSKKLGEGGQGAVYKGSLKDGSMIAVKCLEGSSRVKQSFLAEVQSIGSIHHVNLVRLRGFCIWKTQRYLVYDFMSNGSLDRWIYNGNEEYKLDWKCRKKIILDIAKGLAYLHEECMPKIIHLDIKPQNILLDNDFNAKVSDFGLAKLMEKNQTQVMTTMRGTPGYIAPEWLSSIITVKVDVYSFGIVLLEILCGRKHFDQSQSEESWELLRVFRKCWEQETLLDMIDMKSEDMQINGIEVVEMMKLASWCLQTDYTRRPLMSSVVRVLEGGTDVESDLNYNFTDPIQKNNRQEEDLTILSPSILSGPR